jgi:hypothetical protein
LFLQIKLFDELKKNNELPYHGQIRIFAGKVEELIPDRVEAIVADGLRLELCVVVIGTTDLNLDKGGHHAAPRFAAQISVETKSHKVPFKDYIKSS